MNMRKARPGALLSAIVLFSAAVIAALIGVRPDVMDRCARKMRGDRPFLFTSLKNTLRLTGALPPLEAR